MKTVTERLNGLAASFKESSFAPWVFLILTPYNMEQKWRVLCPLIANLEEQFHFHIFFCLFFLAQWPRSIFCLFFFFLIAIIFLPVVNSGWQSTFSHFCFFYLYLFLIEWNRYQISVQQSKNTWKSNHLKVLAYFSRSIKSFHTLGFRIEKQIFWDC